jgi:hypothetical protein
MLLDRCSFRRTRMVLSISSNSKFSIMSALHLLIFIIGLGQFSKLVNAQFMPGGGPPGNCGPPPFGPPGCNGPPPMNPFGPPPGPPQMPPPPGFLLFIVKINRSSFISILRHAIRTTRRTWRPRRCVLVPNLTPGLESLKLTCRSYGNG